MEFSGKVVIVTGSTSGIGKEIAIEFAKKRASVVICGRREEEGRKVQDEINSFGGKSFFVNCDVSKEEDVKNLVSETVRNFGKLNIGVNSAGIVGEMKPIVDYSLEEWNKILAINLTGIFLCMKFQIPEIIKAGGGGSILNISSALGLRGKPDATPYSTAKHAIIGLTKSAALEYGKYNLRINSLCPGDILTEMDEKFYENAENPEALRKERMKSYCLGRMGTAMEVAKAATWLCSEANTFMTGAEIKLDGGKTAK
jgi:NAD(P)-dependent dehydrogenase (short-subunit alcohol dehydrogenase family)